MPGNNDPIYSRVADIQWSQAILLAANDTTGLNVNNQLVYKADATNGGFLQRLRFKPVGSNVTSVARIFMNSGQGQLSYAAAPGAPTGTPSSSGGTMTTGATYVAKIVAVMSDGTFSAVGTESATVSVTGPTGSISWAFTAVSGATSHRFYVGAAAGAETSYFNYTGATPWVQTAMPLTYSDGLPSASANNSLIGELTLPATSLNAAVAMQEIDYPINFALPPGYEIYVGLGTAVAAGWQVTAIGGKY